MAERKRIWFRVVETAAIPLLRVLTRRNWSGRDHIPATGGVVIAANHLSKIDPMTFGHFVCSTGRVPRFLAKSELFSHRILGRVFTGSSMIPVQRGSVGAARSVEIACAAVLEGGCVVVYPEATITRDPNLWPMVGKTGAARIALRTGVPVIPAAHWGEQAILAPYARRPSLWPRHLVHARAGRPVDLEDLRGRPETAELVAQATERIMAAITAELEVIRAQRAPATRFDPRTAGLPEYGHPDQR
ncbi:MAG: lysophospholipid acyltransferase family protein [Sporichthyaceae bacterium]